MQVTLQIKPKENADKIRPDIFHLSIGIEQIKVQNTDISVNLTVVLGTRFAMLFKF
jgi:hypothetical protein